MSRYHHQIFILCVEVYRLEFFHLLYQSLQLNQVDICQSEKDGDLQSKLQAIKTAEEEDFGHSQIGQVMANNITFINISPDEVLAVADSGVPAHQQHSADPGLAEPLHGAGLHSHLHRVHG